MNKAWEELARLEPDTVCSQAGVRWQDGSYLLDSFAKQYLVNPEERTIGGISEEAEKYRTQTLFFFDLSVLLYLVHARGFGLTGRLMKPQQLKGGHHFFTKAHELPLNELAAKYDTDREGFLRRIHEMGGRELEFGDASCELRPVPNMPVTLILWLGDDEFPPRADMLLDSSCEMQFPLDVIWSLAMMTIQCVMNE